MRRLETYFLLHYAHAVPKHRPIAPRDTNLPDWSLERALIFRLLKLLQAKVPFVIRSPFWIPIALLLVTVAPVMGQTVHTEWVWTSDRSAEVRMDLDWPRSLRETVDSLQLVVLSPGDLARIGSGLTEADELLTAAAESAPSVRIIASNFDEIALPPGPALKTGSVPTPGASVSDVGVFRKRYVANLTAPVVTFDAAAGRLRRYRQITFQVDGVSRPDEAVSATRAGAFITNPHLNVSRSVLADGQVFRIPITEEGVYRIDRDLILAIGLNPDNIEPNNLQILGNGGRPVPALNSDDRIADLAQNPVFVRGGGDGQFDSGDVLLFFASGPVTWTWSITDGWEHTVHPYSVENAYFLRVGSEAGVRVSSVPFVDDVGMPVIQQATGRHVTDIEEAIWSRDHESGSDWMSNTIRASGSRQLFQSVTPPNMLSGQATYRARAAIASNPRAQLDFESGGQILAQRVAPNITVNRPERPAASPFTVTFTGPVQAGQPLDLTMRLVNQINEPQAAVDYVQVFYPMSLSGASGYVRLPGPDTVTGPHALEFSGFTGTPHVWDVTDPRLIRSLTPQDFLDVARVRLDRSPGESPRELVAFVESATKTLTADLIAPVPNQNLHGITGFPDLAIVTPPEFLEAAEELAEMRRAEGLSVVVAQTAQIYNEFSGGVPDMRAVRDYFRFLYDRGTTDSETLRYGLMFGDGHYDFRGLAQREGSLQNWVFPFETDESLNTDATYTSDDYFGLLDPNEGVWAYSNFSAVSFERVDIGIGRLTVQSLEQALMVVGKLRRYESPETFGRWRTEYTFVADDGPTGLDGSQDDADLHVQNVDQVAELIRSGIFPAINVKKIYAESFERVFLNGFRIPDAKAEVNAALNEGTLLFNYSGHGGPDGLAQENIFTKLDAEALTNRDKLAIFVTATCSFGWWDLQNEQSGAEALLLNPNGGAIALMTTVRLVYTSGDTTSLNAGLNRALNIELFKADADGGARRLGDALQSTKNTRVGLQGNSRKFNLLGDPSMRLGIPPREVVVESINGVDLAASEAPLKALDRVTIEGSIRDGFGNPDPAFTGVVNLTVFDAVRNVPLLKQVQMPLPYYRIREDLIWRGEARATAGRWAATFVVPKDISYSNERGRVSAYAVSDVEQGFGFTESLIVGGTADNPPDDGSGPEIRLFLNDTTFTAGQSTPPSAELIVKFFDESGINTVGAGVGHEILLVVNGDESGAQDIGESFVSEPDSYQRGEIRRPITLAQAGPGTLSVRAWDVLNNSATADLGFVVTEDEVLSLFNVYNYPNPMVSRTRFVFDHNQAPGTTARVRVRVYTLNGTPVKTINTEEALPAGLLTSGPVQILWDGLDDDLDRIATGIYLYQLRVEVDATDGTTQTSEVVEKLAIIR
jgi:hypothetical protein